MSEIYRDSTTTGLTFDVSSNVQKCEFIRNDAIVATVINASTVQVPYDITRYGGSFIVKWTYTVSSVSYEKTEEHKVVTPLFKQSELVAWDSDFSSLSAVKVKTLESMIRGLVEVYCGQKFEIFKMHVPVKSFNGTHYVSPYRIVSQENTSLTISSGRTSVFRRPLVSGDFNIKIPIEAEAMQSGTFSTATKATLYGEFGWISVPEEVRTAALYIAEAFTCKESLWRERYIKSIRAADWRFDFAEGAFHSTGSVVADQLLEPYRLYGFSAV